MFDTVMIEMVNAIYFIKLKTIIMAKYFPSLWILFGKFLILG